MRYLLPRLEVTGKQPVWCVKILPVTPMDFNNAILYQMRGSEGGTDDVVISGVLLSMEAVVVILVDRKFCLFW